MPERDNLIVLRTFSKLAGMAGVRVGYGVFPLPVIRHLWKVKQPYTPNVAGSIMAIAAMQDREWLDRSVAALTSERLRLARRAAPRSTGSRRCPSHTNFVLCRVAGGRDARAVKQALEQPGRAGALLRQGRLARLRAHYGRSAAAHRCARRGVESHSLRRV